MIQYIFILIASILFIIFGIHYSILGLNKYSYSTGIPMTIYYIVGPISGGMILVFIIEKMTTFLLDS